MSAPANIQSSDQTLSSLFQQYRIDPNISISIKLSKALIARGHAAEALQVTEYSLSSDPLDTEGRIQRAAALLELSRTKAAYVELQRILAISPRHSKAVRMLGRVFVDLGFPERAAELLKKKISAASQEPQASNEGSSRVHVPAIHTKTEAAKKPVIGDLFASLTNDLGLGGFPTDFASETSRVEVTQVVRTRKKSAKLSSGDELSSLVGPIIDQSRPEIQISDESAPTPTHSKPATAYDMVTSTELSHTWDEDDEIKDLPFKVSPSNGELQLTDEQQTVEEPIPRLPSSNLLRPATDDSQATQEAPAVSAKLNPEISPGTAEAAPYLKRFARSNPGVTTNSPFEEAAEDEVRTDLKYSPQRLRIPTFVSFILLVLAFALGMFVASYNKNSETPVTKEVPARK